MIPLWSKKVVTNTTNFFHEDQYRWKRQHTSSINRSQEQTSLYLAGRWFAFITWLWVIIRADAEWLTFIESTLLVVVHFLSYLIPHNNPVKKVLLLSFQREREK